MQTQWNSVRRVVSSLVLSLLIPALLGAAPESGSVTGRVLDALGGDVSGAQVVLRRDGVSAEETTSGDRGRFTFDAVASGRYRLDVRAPGFAEETTAAFFVGDGGRVSRDVALQVGARQQVVVTASATELPTSQVGASVSVVDRETMETVAKPAVLEAFRLMPGAHVVQNGGQGGRASLSIRGGATNFNKVLIDGLPVNEIGGGYNFADLLTAGVESVETLRNANSVLYGTDALSGVVSLTSRRGRTRTPEITAGIDGGSLSTHREDLSLAGAAGRLDYFGEYARFATDNHVPNNEYTNDTVVAGLGFAVGNGGDVRGSYRRTRTDYGVPNAVALYGIADDSSQSGASDSVGLVARSSFGGRWHGVVRLSAFEDATQFLNPAPTGEAFDPFGFGANYVGPEVTIRGGNGTTATGRAILDYGGTYPQPFVTETQRRLASGQLTYDVASAASVSAGLRVEHEEGFTDSGTRSETGRDNFGAFVEARAGVGRLFASAGLGYDDNAVFGTAWTPRLSVAWYLRTPSSTAALGDTKVIANAGHGIKAPSIAQETSSLFGLLASTPVVAAAVEPIGPERSRGLDVGVEQALWQGRLRLRVAGFHNDYSDLVEFLSKPALIRLGVPAATANATAFGAYVNSSSYRARGIETSAEARPGGGLQVVASYTWLDAVVSESFSSSALGPSENPAYPGVPIGTYAPLVGGRPFRRPAHTGNLLVSWTGGAAQLALTGYFAGKADDSTFLTDGFFGSSLLLPNEDLNPGYQKVDLSGSYRLARARLKIHGVIDNLLDQEYTTAFGYRALPRTFRVGITGVLGGDAR